MIIINLDDDEAEFDSEDLLETSYLGVSASVKRPINDNEGICVRATSRDFSIGFVTDKT